MTFNAFDSTVNSLVMQGVPREKAEATARAELRLPADVPDDRVLEADEQREVVKLFTAFGFRVRNLSQYRPSRVARGFPDLFVTHRERPIAFFWETKKQKGGKLSPAQVEFRDDCQRCNVGWASGDRFAARTHLLNLGLARVDGDVLEFVR